MSNTSSRSTMHATTMSNKAFDTAVENFAPKAWSSYTNGADLKVWAREHARTFVHQNSGSSFLPTWYRLISYADSMLTQQEADQKKVGTFPAKRSSSVSKSKAPVAAVVSSPPSPSPSPTRGQLNHILYREATRWWSAFQEEGWDEDEFAADANGLSSIGTDRFVWHCAKVLARSFDSTPESMTTHVETWMKECRSEDPLFYKAF